MKRKPTQNSKRTLFLIAFAALICAIGANAQTQTVYVGKFTLPHQVRWGQAVLPPGDYSIRFSSLHSPATVRSTNGKIEAFIAAGTMADSEKGPGTLTIMIRGNERIVAAMNMPAAHISLVYSPLTRVEREEYAQLRQIETVPLVSAEK